MAPGVSEPSPDLDPPPDGPTRARASWALGLFALVSIAIPLRYYLGDDLYDERFAWRMFSRVRVQECAAEVTEDGLPLVVLGRDPSAPGILPAPWHSLLQRNRPAVVNGFLRWRCEAEGERETVRVTTRCRDTSAADLPPIVREIDCSTGAITEEGSAGGAE